VSAIASWAATPELIVGGLPDDAFKPIEGDDIRACAMLKRRNKAERKGQGPLFAQQEAEIQACLARVASALEDLPDNGPEDIDVKEKPFRITKSSRNTATRGG